MKIPEYILIIIDRQMIEVRSSEAGHSGKETATNAVSAEVTCSDLITQVYSDL